MAKYNIISLILIDFVTIFFIINLFGRILRGSFRFKKIPSSKKSQVECFVSKRDDVILERSPRTVPSVEATRLVQNLALGRGPAVHRNGNVFRTLHHLPSVHAVHSLPNRITAERRVPTAQSVRTIQAAPASQTVNNLGAGLTAVRSFPSLHPVGGSPFFLRSSNLGTQLDLSQFRFVNAGQVI